MGVWGNTGSKSNTVSIRRRLITSFTYLFLYLLIVSISMYAMNKRIDQEFSLLTGYNERFWQISSQQLQVQELFQQTLRARDVLSIEHFARQQETLGFLLSGTRYQALQDPQSQILLRILKNMYEYRLQSMTELVKTPALSPKDHAEISYLSLQSTDMNRIAQQLASQEQNAGNRSFKVFVDRESRRGMGTLFVLIFLVIVVGILTLRSISKILSSTQQLIAQTRDLDSSSSIDSQPVPSGYEEIDILTESYLRMRREIGEYISELQGKAQIEIALLKEKEENERKDRLLKQAQLDLLVSQINPHFLFNTLNIIGKTVLLQNSEKSLELIENISLIMRYTLEHKENVVSLAEEIEILHSYLNIQKSRFSERLSYQIKIDTPIETIMIPPFLLQPLIENCIKYGIEKDEGVLAISLAIYTEPRYHVIHVIDNGPGFGESSTEIGHGIGLGNLQRRLALLYGEEALISFSIPLTGQGTDVCIQIPRESR